MNSEIRYFELLSDKIKECTSKWQNLVAEKKRKVRSLIIEVGCEKIPTDLQRLALHFGVQDIREIPLSMRGRLIRENNKHVIEINSDLTLFEKRQTLAHEIAHFIIEDKYLRYFPQRTKRPRNSYGMSYHAVEKLCDNIAAEILLPIQWLRERFRCSPPSLRLVETIAKEANCSAEYVISRLHEEGLWCNRFILWQVIEENISAIRSYPSEPPESIVLIQPKSPKDSMIRKCLFEGIYLEGKEIIIVGDEEYNYQIQCLPDGKNYVLSMLCYDS